jgi:hypothetical protein
MPPSSPAPSGRCAGAGVKVVHSSKNNPGKYFPVRILVSANVHACVVVQVLWFIGLLEIPFLLKLRDGSVDGTGDIGFDPLGLKNDSEAFAYNEVTVVECNFSSARGVVAFDQHGKNKYVNGIFKGMEQED